MNFLAGLNNRRARNSWLLCAFYCLFTPLVNALEIISLKESAPTTTFSIAVDQSGLIWIGSPSGLSFYDGAHIRTYNQNENSLLKSPIADAGNIFIDSKDQIWMGSWGNALAMLNASRDKFVHFPFDPQNPTSIANGKVQSLYETSNGDMWFGTMNGLSLLRPGSEAFLNFRNNAEDETSLSHNRVWSMAEAQNQKLWLGTTFGLNLMDLTSYKMQRFLVSDELLPPEKIIRVVFVDSENRVWIGNNKGFGLFNSDTDSIEYYSPTAFNRSEVTLLINDIKQDSHGHLIIATDAGLFKFSVTDLAFENFTPGQQQFGANMDVRDIAVDQLGLIWLATRYTGVLALKESLTPIGVISGKTINMEEFAGVWRTFKDAAGRMWIGSTWGLFGYESEKALLESPQTPLHTFANMQVLDIEEDSQQRLWIGTKTSLFSIDKERQNITDHQSQMNFLNVGGINDLTIDHNDDLWILSPNEGLVFYSQDGTLDYQTYGDDQRIRSYSIKSTPQGDIWLMTDNGILFAKMRNENHFKPIPIELDPEQQAIANSVTSFYVGEKAVWMATPNGLIRLDRATNDINILTMADGLYSDDIRSVIEDKNGNLWVATSEGIAILNQLGINQLAPELHAQLDVFLPDASYLSDSGRIYMGSESGLIWIDTKDEKYFRADRSTLLISELQVNGQQKLLPQNLDGKPERFHYDKKDFTFLFSPMNYEAKPHRRIEYKLDGYRDYWVNAERTGLATYTNLNPGDYELLVRFESFGGAEPTQEMASYAFKIVPPFWQTNWFYGLLVLIAATAVWLLLRLRTQVLVNRAESLEKLVENRTTELKARNNELDEANKKLEHLSFTDQLTGLNNRIFFNEFVQNEITRINRVFDDWAKGNVENPPSNHDLCVFILDIDHFKEVNDTFGHHVGDLIIKEFADILKSIFRDTDYIIRWGGEEFVILQRDSCRENAIIVAERIRNTVEGHQFDIGEGRTLSKTCSIGFSAYPFIPANPRAYSIEDVISVADHALYAAKRTSRNAWVSIHQGDEMKDLEIKQLLHDITSMVRANKLRISSSLETPLNWL